MPDTEPKRFGEERINEHGSPEEGLQTARQELSENGYSLSVTFHKGKWGSSGFNFLA
jgi:hypothetical protein